MEQQNLNEVQEQTESAEARTRYPVMTRVLIALSLLLAFALLDLFVSPPIPVIVTEIVVTAYCALPTSIILNAQLLNPSNWKGEANDR
jgi:hypothetical protein